MKLPEGYPQEVIPYLILKGATGFKEFVMEVFDAKEKMIVPGEGSGIMHGEMTIGKSVIMFADSTDQFPPQTAALMIYVDNADVTYKMALERGAKSLFIPDDKEYGRSAGVIDNWGNSWYITSV